MARFAARAAGPAMLTQWKGNAAAFAAYLLLSFGLFGAAVVTDPARTYVGLGPGGDAESFMWFLVWWPQAVLSGSNPILTDAIWAPGGFNLATANTIPAPSLLFAPLTLAAGPVVAYNVITVAAPAASAFTAFLLCRQLSGALAPSVVGGYVFGFSPYVLGHILGHTSHTLALLVPLLVYLVVRFVRGRLSPTVFVLLFALVVVAQFLIAMEVLFTTMGFGAIAIGLSALWLRETVRPSLKRLLPLLGLACGVATLAVSPWLYYLFTRPRSQYQPALPYGADLANFAVPTPLAAVHHHILSKVNSAFTAGNLESTAYVGGPLLIVTLWFLLERRRKPATRVLGTMLLLVAVASLGPVLRIAGRDVLSLPWAFAFDLPVVRYILPGRFTVHVFLILGLIVTLWLADARRRRIRWVVALAAVVAFLPDIVSPYWKETPFWRSSVGVAPFFSDRTYREHLREGETIVIFPIFYNGSSMLAQAETRMYFRLAGGYPSSEIPPGFRRWPVLHTLLSGQPIPEYRKEVRKFLCEHGVSTIVVQATNADPWERLAREAAGTPATRTAGVSLYRLDGVCASDGRR